MRYREIPVLIIIALVFTGCGIPSVHPIYEPADLVYDEQFAGRWSADETDEVYEVYLVKNMYEDSMDVFPSDSLKESFELPKYLEFLNEKGLTDLYFVKKVEEEAFFYLGGLVRLNGIYFLDLFRVNTGEQMDAFRFPVHIFVKLEQDENQVSLYPLKQNWLQKMISDGETHIRHESTLFDDFILTASTLELKQFLVKFGDREEAYGDKTVYQKTDEHP